MKNQNMINRSALLLWKGLACLASGERVRPKSSNIFLTFFLTSFLSLHPAKAQTTALSLDEAVREALEQSPGVKATFHEYQASLERVAQARALPNPEVSLSFFLQPMERWVGNQLGEVSVMQMFPWFGSQTAMGDEATAQARSRFYAFENRKRETEEKVRIAWLALYAVEREISFLEEDALLVKDMVDQTLAQYQSADGKTSMVDVLNQKMELREVESALLQMRQKRFAQERELLKFLDKNRMQVSTTSQLPAISESEMETWATAEAGENPMVRMFLEEAEMQHAREKAARKEGAPMVGVGASYMVFEPRPGGEAMMNGQNMFMPMLRVTLPIYRKSVNASVREAREMAVAGQMRMDEQQRQVRSSRTGAVARYRQAQVAENLANEQLELVDEALGIIIESYKTGAVGQLEWLGMKRRKINYERNKVNSQVTQHEAFSELKTLR